ncbi:MAG TPA: hypothetical protein EYP92_03055 [Candidatus Thioglobus sp.]|nr:hypothetical protein [Candidatus Thioglobus sp.]
MPKVKKKIAKKVAKKKVAKKKIAKKKVVKTSPEDKMAKARAAKKPPTYKNVHQSVKDLDDDHYLSLNKVKEWEKHNKDILKELKSLRRLNRKTMTNKELRVLERDIMNREGYVKWLALYLSQGEWLNLFYGKEQEHKMEFRTVHAAYDSEGFKIVSKTLDIDQEI